jgi:NAD(P)-dependent dehydrogenase (short-subunit alcohol dehydrogenase family)
MGNITLNEALLSALAGKTAVVTGAAGGIGGEITRMLILHGANVAMADLELARFPAETIISSLPDPSRSIFVPTNILQWSDIISLFKTTISKFGSVDIVVANAGVMESKMVLDMDEEDEKGNPIESKEFSKVIDINLKGTMNSKYCTHPCPSTAYSVLF